MSLFSRLFGSSEPKKDPVVTEDYKGFAITPEPIKESDGHRIAARIEKEIDGAMKTHHLIRADVCSNLEEAIQLSATKAKQMVDQEGDRLFR